MTIQFSKSFLIKGSYESISLKSHVLYFKYLSDSDTDGNWIFAQDDWCFGLSEQLSVDPYLTSYFKFTPYGYKCKKWKHKNTKRNNGRKVFYNLEVHKEYKKIKSKDKQMAFIYMKKMFKFIHKRKGNYTEEYRDLVFQATLEILINISKVIMQALHKTLCGMVASTTSFCYQGKGWRQKAGGPWYIGNNRKIRDSIFLLS